MKEWWTPKQIEDAKLPGLDKGARNLNLHYVKDWRSIKNVNGEPLARKQRGVPGGGWEYHYTLFPDSAQWRLIAQDKRQNQPAAEPEKGTGELWDEFDRIPERRKAKARDRMQIVEDINALCRGGLQKNTAVAIIAAERGVGPSTIFTWFKLITGKDKKDWLPALAPRNCGRTISVECDQKAWDFLKADYLRWSRPSFATCFERLQMAARENDWSIPSARTLERRMETEIPKAVRIYLREGESALKQAYPPQIRDRSNFHALEAVNVDGHKWDVFVRWPDGTISRPLMVAIQDLYSNKFLGWRIDRSENSDVIRLAFRDVFEKYGIPDHCYLDNGRAFAAKAISGGTTNRFRFKVKPEEPTGILTSCGVELHWTLPYSGQSKPIERAFKDFCDAIAKCPQFEGAYTGNSPDAKPENYGNAVIPIEEFIKVVDQGIQSHNARTKRNTRVCGRIRSFDQAFIDSYKTAPIRKARPEHLRMLMLAAENVTPDRRDGGINLAGNRYWSEISPELIGSKVTARFDPDNYHAPVHVYRLDGSYIGAVDCIEAVGFADKEAAREHARNRKDFIKHTKLAAAAETKMTIEDLVKALPDLTDEEPPEQPSIVRLVHGNLALQTEVSAVEQTEDEEEHDETVVSFMKGVANLARPD